MSMAHLMLMKNNIIDYEKKVKKPTSGNYRGRSGQAVRLAYKINGYWFCLTLRDWAFTRDMSVSTVRNRYATRKLNNKTTAQILGFEEMKYQKKNAERYHI